MHVVRGDVHTHTSSSVVSALLSAWCPLKRRRLAHSTHYMHTSQGQRKHLRRAAGLHQVRQKCKPLLQRCNAARIRHFPRAVSKSTHELQERAQGPKLRGEPTVVWPFVGVGSRRASNLWPWAFSAWHLTVPPIAVEWDPSANSSTSMVRRLHRKGDRSRPCHAYLGRHLAAGRRIGRP